MTEDEFTERFLLLHNAYIQKFVQKIEYSKITEKNPDYLPGSRGGSITGGGGGAGAGSGAGNNTGAGATTE